MVILAKADKRLLENRYCVLSGFLLICTHRGNTLLAPFRLGLILPAVGHQAGKWLD